MPTSRTPFRRSLDWLWLIPGIAFTALLFFSPLAWVFWTSVTDPSPGFGNYETVFTDKLYVHVLWNSVYSAFGATIGCIAIGYPVAYAIYRAAGRRRQVRLGLVLFSYAVGTVPRTFSWLVVLGDHGLVNGAFLQIGLIRRPIQFLYNQTGVWVGMVHVMLPFVILILFSSMMRVSTHLVPVARTLGARPSRAFLEIFLPLTRPGVTAATMLVFVYSLGFYIVPAVLGGAAQTTVVMEIRELALNLGIWGLAAALSSLVVVVSAAGAAVYVRITGLSDVYARH